jgi:hypothetical protein
MVPTRVDEEYQDSGFGQFGFAYHEHDYFDAAICDRKGRSSLIFRRRPRES